MNSICLLINNELKPTTKKVLSVLFINLVGVFLFYLVFILGLNTLLPRINFISTSQYMFPGIIAFISGVIAYGLSSVNTWKMLNVSGLMDQIRTSNLSLWQIHLSKSISFVIETIIHMVLSSIFLYIVIGFSLPFAYILFFWVYLIFGVFFIIQIGIIVSTLIVNQTTHFLIIIFIVIPLFLLSGMIIPTSYYPEVFSQIIYYIPTTAIIEGGRELFINHSLNLFYFLYLIGLGIVTYFVSYSIFKRKLER